MSVINVDIRECSDAKDVERLALEIVSLDRVRPIVAFTCRKGEREPALDPKVVATERLDVEVWVLRSESTTRELSIRLEKLTGDSRLSPYRGAVGIWFKVCSEVGKPAFRLIVDRNGDYGEFQQQELVRALKGSHDDSESFVAVLQEKLELEKTRRVEADRDLRESREQTRKLKEQLNRGCGGSNSGRKAKDKAVSKSRARSACDSNTLGIEREIATFWLENLQESGKSLPVFTVDPGFEESFRRCEGLKRSILVEKAAMTLCDIGQRNTHHLRTGKGGNDPQQVLGDGTKVWRSQIKQNCADAPRLHYGLTPGGRFVLLRVCRHKNVKAK